MTGSGKLARKKKMPSDRRTEYIGWAYLRSFCFFFYLFDLSYFIQKDLK
jgi:hypothetical protein